MKSIDKKMCPISKEKKAEYVNILNECMESKKLLLKYSAIKDDESICNRIKCSIPILNELIDIVNNLPEKI